MEYWIALGIYFPSIKDFYLLKRNFHSYSDYILSIIFILDYVRGYKIILEHVIAIKFLLIGANTTVLFQLKHMLSKTK